MAKGNFTNFPKPKRGYILDAGDRRAIKKKKLEIATKRRLANKVVLTEEIIDETLSCYYGKDTNIITTLG